MDQKASLADIDAVLVQKPFGEGGRTAVYELAAAYAACIMRNAPAGTVYRSHAERYAQEARDMDRSRVSEPYAILLADLRALRHDVAAGRLTLFEEQVRASAEGSFLDQADELLVGTWRRAAAVLAGCTLEQHLRLLAVKHGISLLKPNGEPKSAGALNDELHGAKAYVGAGADHSANLSRIKIRNEAAHGEAVFDTRTPAEIRLMIDATRDFLARHPA